jgi:hypothetical protein
MDDNRFNCQDAVAMLERTPATLGSLLNELPDRWTSSTEGEGSWSPYDVIGHLVHGERTDWIPRARHILAGETGAFVPFDRNAQFSESKGKDIVELLATFADLRRRNLETLVGLNLTPSDFEHQGLHPELGEVTLRQLLATWVVHDLDHVSQIAFPNRLSL